MLRQAILLLGPLLCLLGASPARAGIPTAFIPMALASADSSELQWWGAEQFATATDSLRLEPGQKRIALSRTRILDPVEIRLGLRVLVEAQDYQLDRARGRVILLHPPEEAMEFRASYRFDPLAAPARVQLHSMQRSATTADSVEVDVSVGQQGLSRATASAPSRQRLQVSGSKTIAVQGGSNREATVDQGLQLSINGHLTETTQVRAEISDENLPIIPEGATEELRDIDQVRIEIFGPHGRALMGDFEINQSLGVFVPYQRKLQGLWLHGRDKVGTATLFGGSPRGQRIQIEAYGQEGLQGPYELLNGLRNDQSYIVAGSERVWVDGQPQVRGENRDYTVDYIRGTITFTELRPIGPENRVAVDFEVSSTGYGRTVVGALVDSTGYGPLRLRAAWMRQADDPGRPLGGPMSADDEEVLSNAGDDPNLALSDGVTRVPPGEEGTGLYAERDSMGVTFYEYAEGLPEANYFLNFERVDPATGDYIQRGINEQGVRLYVYVGPGGGDFVIGRSLPLPTSTIATVLGLALQGAAPEEQGYLRGELNLTDHDENLLSNLDDEDNEGEAWRAEGATPWFFGRGLPQGIRLLGLAESIGTDFYELGRVRAPFYYDAWNLQSVPRESRETHQELRVTARSGQRRTDASIEGLQRLGVYEGRRARWAANGPLLGPFNWRHDLAWMDHDGSEGDFGDRRDLVAQLGVKLGHFEPFVRFDGQQFREGPEGQRTGYQSEKWGMGLISEYALAAGRLEFSHLLSDSLSTDGSIWLFQQDMQELRGAAVGNAGPYRWNLDATLRESVIQALPKETTRLGRIGVAWQPPTGRWGLAVDYRAGNNRTRSIQREIIFVGERQGAYDREGYRLGQNLGDYTVVEIPGDSLIAATDVELGVKMDGEWMAAPLSGGMGFNGQYNLSERSQDPDVTGILRLDPDVLRNPLYTVYGEQRVRLDLIFLKRVRRSNLRFVFDEAEVMDRRYSPTPELSYRRERSVRLDQDLNRGWSLSLDGGDRKRSRFSRGDEFDFLNSYDVDDLFVGAQLGYRASARTRLSLDGRYSARQDAYSGIEQDVLEAVPGLTTDLLGGRWTTEFRWAEVMEQGGNPLLRPFFFERPGSNRRFALSAQWALGKLLSITVRYSLRGEPDRRTVQDLSLETRARF